MSADERPRPQFGEYATPEEQRARIRQPDVTAVLDAGQAPDAAPAASEPPASAPERKPSSGDRIATFALLGYGLFTVLSALPSAFDYEEFANTFFTMLGVDATLSDPAGARGWGIAAAVVLLLGWVATAVLAWRSLAARRLTFWIPLVSGVVVNMVSSVLLVMPMVTDPTVWSAIRAVLTPGL